MSTPTVISTFAGCGGSSLGYQLAGFRELLAVEWDDNAVATFRLNFPDVPVYYGDIAALSVEECLSLARIAPGDLDILDGSPPCQGFSTAGKRVLDDPRNQLFREYVRLLRGLRPKVFVMENVSGLVKGKMKLMFAEIMRELKASGYVVSARLMNAMYFDVPQSRERLIFIGVRDDLGIAPSHPAPHVVPTCLREALRGVENTPVDLEESRYPEASTHARLLRVMKPGDKGHQHHPNGAMFGLKRLRWDRPARAVLREDGGGASCQNCHPDDLRRLTIPEIKRVSSFPDDFLLTGDVGTRWARIGNSVPPNFMRAIAAHIRDHILAQQGKEIA
jgi:DNA (cytosine-5)-methyltransferase 1